MSSFKWMRIFNFSLLFALCAQQMVFAQGGKYRRMEDGRFRFTDEPPRTAAELSVNPGYYESPDFYQLSPQDQQQVREQEMIRQGQRRQMLDQSLERATEKNIRRGLAPGADID